MSRPVKQEDFGLSSFRENVLDAAVAGASVHVLHGNGDVQRGRQSDNVNVIRLFVHRLYFLYMGKEKGGGRRKEGEQTLYIQSTAVANDVSMIPYV